MEKGSGSAAPASAVRQSLTALERGKPLSVALFTISCHTHRRWQRGQK